MDGQRAIGDAASQVGGVTIGTRVGVLGPVRIEVGGVERPITARRQRAVLACLVLHTGEAVSADRLLDEVWGSPLMNACSSAMINGWTPVPATVVGDAARAPRPVPSRARSPSRSAWESYRTGDVLDSVLHG